MYLHACQVRGTVGDSGLCCCACVTSFELLINSLECCFYPEVVAGTEIPGCGDRGLRGEEGTSLYLQLHCRCQHRSSLRWTAMTAISTFH